MIRTLYQASQAGVSIQLIVRGFCCLRPGVPGLSQNIRITSVVGRFLEHSRIYYFRDAQPQPLDGRFFIGSADWMSRNLGKRVEVVVPVEELAGRQRLWSILEMLRSDQRQTWDMASDGSYVQRRLPNPDQDPGIHARLLAAARQAAEPASGDEPRRTE